MKKWRVGRSKARWVTVNARMWKWEKWFWSFWRVWCGGRHSGGRLAGSRDRVSEFKSWVYLLAEVS